MIKHNVANYIIQDLSCKNRVPNGYGFNSGVISDVVEGWNQKIYIVPNQALKINHNEPEKYIFM